MQKQGGKSNILHLSFFFFLKYRLTYSAVFRTDGICCVARVYSCDSTLKNVLHPRICSVKGLSGLTQELIDVKHAQSSAYECMFVCVFKVIYNDSICVFVLTEIIWYKVLFISMYPSGHFSILIRLHPE